MLTLRKSLTLGAALTACAATLSPAGVASAASRAPTCHTYADRPDLEPNGQIIYRGGVGCTGTVNTITVTVTLTGPWGDRDTTRTCRNTSACYDFGVAPFQGAKTYCTVVTARHLATDRECVYLG